MDQVSLFTILTVSLPEAILNIYVGFVLTGQRNRLYLDDKLNIIRLLIAAPLMIACAVITRTCISNFAVFLILNILIYSIIIKFVYSINWQDAILSVVIFVGILLAIEMLYFMQFLTIVNKSLYAFYSDDVLRFFTSIPERVIQVLIIISFWKWDLVFLNIRSNKKLLSSLVFLAFLLISTEALFTFSFLQNFDVFSVYYRILFIFGFVTFSLINYFICHIVIMLSKK